MTEPVEPRALGATGAADRERVQGSSKSGLLSSDFVRSALDSSPDATVVIDATGAILFANRQFSQLFGYDPGEILGQSVERLMPERFRDTHTEHRFQFTAERRARPMGIGLELFAQRKDGAEFPVEISLSPVLNEAQPLVIAAIRNITDRKRVQAELIAAREAAERARQVADAARESADYANQAKSRFLATASHDLRQPLQTLALLNGTLQRMVRDPEVLEVIAQEDQAIGAMSRLLNALLDISKLESGAIKPNPEDFAVAALLEELRQEFGSLAADKGIRLEVRYSGEYAYSDPSLVGQILRNLVSNAIKYTRQGTVSLHSLSSAATVRIEVLDTGIGIPAHQLPYIYDEFYQIGVNPNTTREGYGLGLSIVRRLVKLLGLKLDVRSVLGRGSTFALELPPGTHGPTRSRDAVKPATAPAGRDAPEPLVLLVEDDPAVRDATRLLLKVSGYRVLTAGSLAEARERATQQPEIDLLVTDYHLSNNETGTQVIAELRTLLRRDLKVILVTGDTSSAVRELERDQRLRLASKPINADELLARLQTLLMT